MVWRVVHHGITDGRDSGYPTTNAIGPIFSTRRGAQDEADRLLATLPERLRVMSIPQIHPLRGTYDFRNLVDKPTYEAVQVKVLSQKQADERQQGFIDEENARIRERADRLKAEAEALIDRIS